VAPSDVLPGVRELVDLVSLEVLLEDGTRLVTLVDPLGRGEPADPRGPGAIVPAVVPPPSPAGDARPVDGDHLDLVVRNTSRRVVRVSSHFPFDRVNARLELDRAAARGFRLDLDAGSSERWAPGETRTVRLVPFRGHGEPPDGGTEA
jgi:urease subunit gamma/beta